MGGRGEVLESIETDRNNISKVLKGLDPHKAHCPAEVSPYVLRECGRTGGLKYYSENHWKRV